MSLRMRLANWLIDSEARRRAAETMLAEARDEAAQWAEARKQWKKTVELLNRQIADLQRDVADVPAQGYVHGLDPAEEDPRRGVLE